MTDKRNDKDETQQDNKPSVQPDRETTKSTDPQDNMKGPVSSTTRNTGHTFETDESKQHADRIKEKNL